MDYVIDLENRRVMPVATALNLGELKIINEFDILEKKFLPNTEDEYQCELVLLDVGIHDDNMNIIGIETKAFARRLGFDDWLMPFTFEEYSAR